MKKDIEWLKAQICTEMMYLDHIRKERWSGVKYQTLRSVYQKINQLDEPEVLSQEWIHENKEMYLINDTSENAVPDYKLQSLLVPKQELPVIPKYVADWWERDGDSVTLYGGLQVKKKHKFDLVSIFHDKGLGDYLSRVEDWIDENKSIFLELVNGKPYEVEEEQKYNVQLKARSSFGTVGVFLYKQGDEVLAGDNFRAYYPEDDKFRLTEQEIKDFDPRCWEFRKPV